MNICLILSGYQDTTIGICKCKSIVNGNKEIELILNIILIFLMLK
jgi:hypothetical protein